MNSLQIGVVNSILTVGGLIGALVSGTVAAQYGRRTALLWNSSTLIIGPILEAAAPTVWVMAVGRFISGLGVGTSTVVTPLMISEIAVPKYKGFFGSFTQTSINSGIFLAQLLGFFLSYGQMWRVILGVGGLLAVAHLVFLFFIDESPKWLADNDRASEGRKVLRKLRGDHFDIQEEVAGWGIEEADELESQSHTPPTTPLPLTRPPGEEQALLHDGSGPGADRTSSNAKDATKNATAGILAVLTHPHYNRAVLAVMFLMAAQQFCGINSIIVYGVSLLSSILTTSAALLNVLVAVLNFTVTLAFAPLIDRLGRKTCLLASVTGMGVSSLLLAVGIGRGINILSAIMVLTFVGFFGLGLGPIPFILSSELVGPEAVGATQSWALAASWVSTFVVTQFFPLVNEKVGKGRVYYVFFAFAMVTVLFVSIPYSVRKVGRERNVLT